MDSPSGHTQQLETWLAQLRDGDSAVSDDARRQVIEHTSRRLEALAGRMLKRYPRLRRWEQTADVMQNSIIRLSRSLETVKPRSAREFYGLAATQIRRELIDLVRHHFGPEGPAAHHYTDRLDPDENRPHEGIENRAARSEEPSTLLEWAEFHELVGQLPETEREIVHLLWYEGLTQQAAAEVLGVSDRTVKSRWRDAKLVLKRLLDGEESS